MYVIHFTLYCISHHSWHLSNYDINGNCYKFSLSIKTVVEDTISKAKINLSEVADTLKGDWVILATQLDISGDEIHKINSDYRTVNDQALAMLSLWKEKKGDQATGQWVERSRALFTKVIVSKSCKTFNVHKFWIKLFLYRSNILMNSSVTITELKCYRSVCTKVKNSKVRVFKRSHMNVFK